MKLSSATLFYITFSAMAILLFAGCSKDNKLAEKMDGTWGFDALTWTGSDTHQGGTQDSLGVWTLNACKTTDGTCDGEYLNTVRGFTETFQWTIADKGETFVIEASDTTTIGNLAGDWKFWSKSENKYILTSTLCADCPEFGEHTIVLNRR